MAEAAWKTTDYLTKFEFTRVVGLRILQLQSHGTCSEEPRVVALQELLDGSNAAVVRRRLPDGTTEDRPVASLRLSAVLRRMCIDGAAR